MCGQYEITLMSMERGTITHRVNCSEENAAYNICRGLYPDMRVIEMRRVFGHAIQI